MRWRDWVYALIVAAIMAMLITSIACCPCKNIAASDIARDSIEHRRREIVRITLRDTLVMRLLPQSHDMVLVEESHSFLENDYCTTSAEVDDRGRLRHTLDTKDSALLPSRVEYRDSVVVDTLMVFRNRVQERVVTKEVRKAMWYDKCLRIVCAGLAIVVVWQNRKHILMMLLKLWRI